MNKKCGGAGRQHPYLHHFTKLAAPTKRMGAFWTHVGTKETAMLISVTRMHVQVPIPQKWYSVWPVHLVDGKYVRFTRKTTVICCDCSETSIVDPVAIPVWWAIIIIPHFVHLYALSWLVGEISQSFSSCILPITYRHSNTTGRCEPSFKHQMFIPNNR